MNLTTPPEEGVGEEAVEAEPELPNSWPLSFSWLGGDDVAWSALEPQLRHHLRG